jgi:hypothetical protein
VGASDVSIWTPLSECGHAASWTLDPTGAVALVPSNFGYGGVIVSYNLFDFGKREHAVKEARAQLGMADIAPQIREAC